MAGILFFAFSLAACPSPLSLLAALCIHEAGHILTAYILGFGRPSVSMNTLGIRLYYHGTHNFKKVLAVTLAGSIAGILVFLLPFLPLTLRLFSLGFSLVSLLPISSLDGGGALLCILDTFMLPDRSYRIASAVSVIFTLLFWVLSVGIQMKIGANLTLILLSAYLTVTVLTKQ